MRAFKGAFHSNPQYSQAEGIGKMEQDLADIKQMAAGLRSDRAKTPKIPPRKAPGTTKPTAN
jgi:hypothetical protein